MTRYVEIDGCQYSVGSCSDCLFYDRGGNGHRDACKHPLMPKNHVAWDDKAYDRRNGVCYVCPLNETKQFRVCKLDYGDSGIHYEIYGLQPGFGTRISEYDIKMILSMREDEICKIICDRRRHP